MKVTVSFKAEDGKTYPDIAFVPGETFAATLEQFDQQLEKLLAVEVPVPPPAAPESFPAHTRKGPYSPSNPAHPKEKK